MTISGKPPCFASIEQLKTVLTGEGCRRCSLGFQPEINGVCVSRGDTKAKAMIIGEAPGKTEDSNGKPFSGPAGQLLERILGSVGLSSERDFYVTNVVKCRPYSPRGSGRENFTPKTEQQELCRPYLDQEIELINPKLIVLLGKTAVDNLLPELKSSSMTECRGKLYHHNNRAHLVMYHPAYLLRQQGMKSYEKLRQETWLDVQYLKQIMETPSP